MLSEHRDLAAAEAFFCSVRTVTGTTPARVATDGHNRLEQDYRGMESLCRPMLGLKSLASAARLCRCHDELRNFLHCRSRMRRHLPPAVRRWQHMRKAAIVLHVLATA